MNGVAWRRVTSITSRDAARRVTVPFADTMTRIPIISYSLAEVFLNLNLAFKPLSVYNLLRTANLGN